MNLLSVFDHAVLGDDRLFYQKKEETTKKINELKLYRYEIQCKFGLLIDSIKEKTNWRHSIEDKSSRTE